MRDLVSKRAKRGAAKLISRSTWYQVAVNWNILRGETFLYNMESETSVERLQPIIANECRAELKPCKLDHGTKSNLCNEIPKWCSVAEKIPKFLPTGS